MAEFSAPPRSTDSGTPWYRELNRYHWWVLIVCILGWTFDTMDQRLFVLARGDAMKELAGEGTDPAVAGRWATAFFMFGWATGGIIFGILGDKWGRAKTMMLTILVYAIFTAFSGLSTNLTMFMIFRFLTGLGVGGEFSAGVALLTEVIPARPRPHALGLMQGLSAVGNLTGATIGYFVLSHGWEYLFFVGAFPALLVVFIRGRLKEPDTWLQAKAESKSGNKKMGSYQDLFGHPKWRKHALLGAGLAVIGVTGVWGIGFYSPELVTLALADAYAHLDPAERSQAIARAKSVMTFCQDIGAFFGMYGFAVLSQRIGRKPTFYFACIMGLLAILFVFGRFNSPGQLMPYGFVLGFGTMWLFGGYAVYFAEIFPTRLRSTGVSFCYNVGRYLAAVLQLLLPYIMATYVLKDPEVSKLSAYRTMAMAMSLIYLLGIVIVYFLPETLGKPLPTDDEEPMTA